MANSNKDVKRGIVLYLDGKAVEANAHNIQREMRKVKKEIDGCTFGSKEYVEATKRYRELNGILQEHKNKLREVKTEHFSFINTVNSLWQKWNVTIGAFLAAFTGVSLALSKFRKEMNAEEESAANLKALTGLDDSNIDWLKEQARELSTTMEASGLRVRQATTEILEAYMMVGSAKPELLGNKEALNAVTVEALRLSSAAGMELKPAVEGITLAMNQYGASAEEAARYVNVLAAGSKAGAADVESQTSSIVKAGVAASTAKVPIEGLVGSIETLAEKGIKGEVAGTGLKTFFLKLEGMADDVRPSVVGLETALENLRKKNLSTAETQKMFGLEAYTVAQTMIQGADRVREFTAAVTDTNIAVEQAAINSDTANAKLDQMKNQFAEQGKILVQELNPAITKVISLGMNSTRMLVALIEFVTKYRTTLALTSAAIALYITWQKRKIIQDQLMTLWQDKIVVGAGKVRAAFMKNPWGLALIGITAVVTALIDFNKGLDQNAKKITAQTRAQQKASDEYRKQSEAINRLNAIVHDETYGYNQRNEALNELKKIVPGYHANLTKEGKLINDNKKALDHYLVSLEKEIKIQAKKDELTELYKRRDKLEKTWAQQSREYWDTSQTNTLQGYNRNSLFSRILRGLGIESEGSSKDALDKTSRELSDVRTQIEELEGEIKEAYLSLDSTIVTGGNDGGGGGSGSGGGSTTTTKNSPVIDRIKQQTAAINLEYQNRQTILKQQYAQGIIDRQKYNSEIEALELERINRLLKIAGLEPEKVAELQAKIQDIAIKAREELEGLDTSFITPGSLDDFNNRQKELNDKMQQQIATLKRNLNLGNITHDTYLKEMNKIDSQHFLESMKIWDEYTSNLTKKVSENTDEVSEIIKKLEEAGFDIKSVAEDLGEAIGKGVAGGLGAGKDLVKEAMKSLLMMIIDGLEKLATAAFVESSLLTLTGIGTAKGLANLAKLAAIKAVSAGLKAGVNAWMSDDKGYASGGYTGIGGAYEPAGVVHRGEFVANRFAVANPAVRSVLDLIDAAQRSGSVANLTADDLRSVSLTTQRQTNSDVSDATLLSIVSVVSECTKMLASVKSRFDQPIVAETYATGRGGTLEAQKKVAQMNKNASRN